MIPKAGDIISIIIAGPMTVGLTGFSLSLARKQEVRFEQIFDGFKKFQVALLAYVAATVFVLLWALLLIVPGVIAAFHAPWSTTFLPKTTRSDAWKQSAEAKS
jgi:uncharacterized membrane protein